MNEDATSQLTGAQGVSLGSWRSGEACVSEWRRRGTRVTVNGESIFVIDAAAQTETAQPPLLILHGFPTSSIDWAVIFPALNANRRVLCIDVPGFGFSDKPDRPYSVFGHVDVIEAVLEHCGVNSFDLITHDMGDSIGGELLARDNQERVRRRVVTNGSIYMDIARMTDEQKLLLALSDQALPPELTPDVDAVERSLIATYAPAGAAERYIGNASARCVILGNGGAMLPRVIRYTEERYEHERRWTGAIESHPAPLSVVWGWDDPIAVNEMAERLCAARPDAVLTRLDGVGHYPMLEAPRAVATAVLEALA